MNELVMERDGLTAQMNQIKQSMKELNSQLDSEASDRFVAAKEAERAIRELRQSLDEEVKERVLGDDDQSKFSTHLLQSLEQQALIHKRDMEDFSQRLEAEANPANQRGLGHVDLHHEFAREKETRDEAHGRIHRSLLNLDEQVQKRLNDLRARIDRCEKRLGTHADRDFVIRKHEETTETLTDCWALVRELSEKLDAES